MEKYSKENVEILLNNLDDKYTLIDLFKKEKAKYMRVKHELCGKEYDARLDKFFGEGQRCTCLRKRNNAQIKDLNDYQIFLDNEYNNEYTAMSNYLGRKKPISLKHSCDFEYDVERAEFLLEKSGGICPVCNPGTHNSTEIIKKRLNNIDPDIEFLEEYRGVNESYKVFNKKCSHTYFINLNSILTRKERTKCPECDKYSKHINIERVKKEIESTGFLKLLSTEYNGTHEHLEVECKKCGNVYSVSRTNVLSGKGCPHCAKISSKEEKELLEFIKSVYKNDIKENTLFNKKYELDIYLPDLKIGFEYNGLYWHSDTFKDKDYHINKTNFFKDLGIRVVHIFEDEWLNKQEIVKNKIKNILGVSDSEKIPARKIIIKEISNKEKTPFLNEYHIQGSDQSIIKLGGFYNDELVAVMTFSKLRNSLGSKKKNLGEYELSRYATSKNVIGGFSKLLKYAINNYDIQYIKTFADLRWSNFGDNVYAKNGFSLLHLSEPNYFYIPNSSKIRYHRFNFRKQVLKEKFPMLYDEDLTEFQIMDKSNYLRIWDCGNLVYEMFIKKDKA